MSFEEAIQLFNEGDYERSIEFLSELIDREPLDYELYYSRACNLERLGNYPAALIDLDEAVNLNSDDNNGLGLYFSRGEVNLKMHRYVDAVGDFTEDIDKFVVNSLDWALFNRGTAYLALRDYSKAISDFSDAIQSDPNESAYYYHRVLAYIGDRDSVRAAGDLETAIQMKNGEALAKRLELSGEIEKLR